MASGIYERHLFNLMGGLVDLDTGGSTVQVSLYDSTHAFTAADNVYTSTNELASAGGYTLGGSTLAGQSVTQGTTTKFDGTDTAWTSATFTAYHAVLWDDTIAGDDLIASIDFGGAKTVTSGTFTIQWHTDGIITLAE